MLTRTQSIKEEFANSLSHGIGLMAALAAVPVLVVTAVQRGSPAGILGASVFAVTVVLLYTVSTLYHAIPSSRAKQLLKILDHSAIFLLIAGTYTPFSLGVLRGPWGWTLFGIVWGLAFAGMALAVIGRARYQKLSVCLYLLMGWLGLIVIKPLWFNMPAWGFFWLVAGGITYTTGVAFFVAKNIRYNHFVWHLFVIAGTACHFVAVIWYAT